MYVHELKTLLDSVEDGELKILLFDPKSNKEGNKPFPTFAYEGMRTEDGNIVLTVLHKPSKSNGRCRLEIK